MNVELLKQDILQKIREIAERDGGRAPRRDKFLAETGVKPHQWRGKIWRVWGDALAEAGYAPNELQPAFEDSALLEVVCQISRRLNRFPSTSDIEYEVPRLENGPNPKTIMARWKMAELANALAAYAAQRGEVDVEQFARDYVSPRSTSTAIIDPESAATGFVYLQRHGTDYKSASQPPSTKEDGRFKSSCRRKSNWFTRS